MELVTSPPITTGPLIQERREVLNTIKSLAETSELPIVGGYTHDRRGTALSEQGLSYHKVNGEAVIGFHVVDVSIIQQGGAIDLSGYTRQTESVSSGRIGRIIDDPILFRHLSLNDRVGSRYPIPVMSFYLQPRVGHLAVIGANHDLFVNRASFWHGDEVTRPGTALQKLIDNVRQSVGDPSLNLRNSEYIIARQSANYAAKQLLEVGIEPLKDEAGAAFIHRPLRVWSDFKNLQLFSQVIDGGVPLYHSSQLDRMRWRAKGEGKEVDPADLLPSEIGKLVVSLLQAPDASKRRLTHDEFAKLVTDFDPEARPRDSLLSNIMNWAARRGLVVTLAETNDSSVKKFHNLVNPLITRKGPLDDSEEVAYTTLVNYVQHFPKISEPAHSREKKILKELHDIKPLNGLNGQLKNIRLSHSTKNFRRKVK